MTPEIAEILRKPFPADVVGKLPRVWCKSCREVARSGKTCGEHSKVRCGQCRNNITTAHLHLDYVGHAETTDRFLTADPEWTWEPLAFDGHGLPAFDGHGGLWIRLTIGGTTRLGYGAAEGKDGPDAVKEIIGDALRNAGMRFGVALDLWGATFKDATDHDDVGPSPEDWDAATPATAGQARVFDGFVKDIATAPSKEAIHEIGKSVHMARSSGAISNAHMDLLTKKAAARVAELEAS